MASQTPPPQQTHMVPDTPPVVKNVHSNFFYQRDILADARLAVLQDLGECIPMIPFQTFLDHLAPPFRHGFSLIATMQSLKSGSAPILTSENRWSMFPKAPKDLQGSEDAIFRSMPEIFTKVVLAISASSGGQIKDSESTIDFLQNPTRTPSSAKRHNESRPDGYFVLKDRKKTMSKDGKEEDILWSDIALSCEYKKKSRTEDLNDDVQKCVWSLQHVMRDYLRRRASFGITIENSTARVWFCCRSSVIVSEAFDFIDEPENLIKLFAAFAFADPTSLGFDPTVQPDTGNKEQFVITVHPDNNKQKPRRFRTKQIISSFGAEPLRGRGTRVYEAVEIGENGSPIGQPVVLKDTWIDSDRIREGKVLASIDAAVDGEDRLLFERNFLTRICDGDVWTNFDTLDDTAHLMRGLNVTLDHASLFEVQRMPTSKSDEPPSGSKGIWAMTTNVKALELHPRYAPKTHYRIVFKEKCISIQHIKSLPDVMTILIETVRALQLLRKLGWVHRDVSIGNILSYDGHAKLSDLEYAKKASDQSTHDMRTGTAHFMSIEVAAQLYLFIPSNPGPSSTEVDELAGVTVQDVGPTWTIVPFSHNHLHDLESLWWVAVWMIFNNYILEGTASHDGPSFTLQHAKNQLRLAEKLFPPMMDSIAREHNFKIDKSFLEICKKLPDKKTAIYTRLDLLRRLLVRDYEAIESGYPRFVNANASNDDIYDTFTRIFSALRTITHGLVLESIRDIFEKRLNEENKRPRSESTNDSGVAQKNPRK